MSHTPSPGITHRPGSRALWAAVPGVLCLSLLSACERYPQTQQPTAQIFLERSRLALPPGQTLRSVTQQGLDLTKVSEGFRSDLYHDAAGYCTIGYGHLVKLSNCDGTEPPEFRRGVSQAQGEQLLSRDMRSAQIAVMGAVTVELTDHQFSALCDFVYNVGMGNFNRSTLLRVINREEHGGVPAQLRRWIRAGGIVLEGLQSRREREIDLYFTGLPRTRDVPAALSEVDIIDIESGEA